MDQQNPSQEHAAPLPRLGRRLPLNAQYAVLGLAVALILLGFVASPAGIGVI